MKTQKSGLIYAVTGNRVFFYFRAIECLGAAAREKFIENRENKSPAAKKTENDAIPNWHDEERHTWIKGEKKSDGYVYGVKTGKKDHNGDALYEYELRYDAGPKDLALFEVKDREYLLSLLKEGKLRNEEPAVWFLYVNAGSPPDIGDWWHQTLVHCHYYDREGDAEIQAALQQAAKDEKALGGKPFVDLSRQKALEEAKFEEDRRDKEQQRSLQEKLKAEREKQRAEEEKRRVAAARKAELARMQAEVEEKEKQLKEVEEEKQEQEKLVELQAKAAAIQQQLAALNTPPKLLTPPASPKSMVVKVKDKPPEISVAYLIEYSELQFTDKEGKEELDKTNLDKVQVLGAGAFGVVYRGKWRFNNVAIKKLLLENPEPDTVEEFKAEMQIMTNLHSDNTVALRGCCLQPPCIVMEYMPGGSLYKVLHSTPRQTLDWSTRYKIIAGIANGVAFLHECRPFILHHDLKSLNVLIGKSLDEAKLTDFGLAKLKTVTASSGLAKPKAKDSTSGKEGEEKEEGEKKKKLEIGTVRWTAPEIFEGEAYTRKADVYSMGYTFWEVVSHEIPFFKTISESIVERLIEKGKRDDIPKDCPPKIASLIKFCWMQEAQKRPPAGKVVEYLSSEKYATFDEFAKTIPAEAPEAPAPEVDVIGNLDSSGGIQGNLASAVNRM